MGFSSDVVDGNGTLGAYGYCNVAKPTAHRGRVVVFTLEPGRASPPAQPTLRHKRHTYGSYAGCGQTHPTRRLA